MRYVGPEESKDCAVCLGAGYVKKDVPINHPEYGKAHACTCRDEAFKAKRSIYLNSICRIPPANRFDETAMFPDHQALLESAVNDSGERQMFISTYGSYGVGKTTMLCAAVNYTIGKGLVGVYVTMSDLFNHLRKAYKPDADVQEDKFWDTLISADVLALDEVDRWKPTAWAEEKFFSLIDERYRNNKGVTFIATNKTIDRTVGIIAEQPGYFESRLLEAGNRIIHLKGEDRRQQRQSTLI